MSFNPAKVSLMAFAVLFKILSMHCDKALNTEKLIFQGFSPLAQAQCVERILNKTAKAINETFAGLKLMLQGFRIYFV